jgi:hypothetical protein
MASTSRCGAWPTTGTRRPRCPGFSAVLALDARYRPRWPRFEFGSDAQISANLETLHAATAADAIAVGSVTHDPLVRAVQPRTPNAFDDLARRSGWRIDAQIDRQFSYNLRRTKR